MESISTRKDSCPIVDLSTTNLAWIYLGSNPGLRGERPINNSLGMAQPKKEINLKFRFSSYRALNFRLGYKTGQLILQMEKKIAVYSECRTSAHMHKRSVWAERSSFEC